MNGLVEVARSFAFKLNAGNYQSADFFCSQKAECKPEEVEAVSKRLYDFCRSEVAKAIFEYKQQNNIK
jgi:hypothetical protein